LPLGAFLLFGFPREPITIGSGGYDAADAVHIIYKRVESLCFRALFIYITASTRRSNSMLRTFGTVHIYNYDN
jgi:hypothetical protein